MKGTGIRKFKKGIVYALIAVLVLPLALNGFGGGIRQVQAQNAATQYFYNQLNDKEKSFYRAMEYMNESGMFKTGTENLDLTVGTAYVLQEDLAAYANGSPDLLDWMGAARDAFYFDHPDIFYVDFSALSLRVTLDAAGKYHAYLGTGRRANYFNEAFSSKEQVEKAINEYNTAIDEIVKQAKDLRIDEHMDRIREQVTWVHKYVTNNTAYRLENTFTSKDSDMYLIRTSYGSLVRGKGVCEGYSRAVKAILDRLDIPCVLVEGYYRHTEEQLELHMWNYVQLNGEWYGLDATMDDPVDGKGTIDGPSSGRENTDYLLKGADTMDVRHVPVGIVSSANFEFHYPTLAFASLDYQVLQNSNGLVVEYKTGTFENQTSGFFQVSYKGMGYAKAAKEGKYILSRFYQYVPGKDENDPESYVHNDWAYVEPQLYPAIEDRDDSVLFPVPHCIYAEFAVTSIPPNVPEDTTKFDPNKHSYYFEGDPLLFDAQSDLFYNYEGDYVAPPYPESVTPSLSVRMIREGSYDITVVYNDKLIQVDGETPGYKLNPTGPTALKYSKIENFKWDGDRTISFHFTPSQMFADESTYYYFQFTGLVGEKSEKPPIEISYGVATGICPRGCILCGDYNWKVFGQPSLLGDGDLSMSGWKTSDGEEVSELLKNRIALVVTSPSQKQEDSMQELIKSENGNQKVLASSTYNISLTACKSVVVETGQSIQLSVGFPEGFGPEDEGVTFKAYHFIRNAAGEVTGVEEIPCVVTKFGLIITCRSFSPFAIAAVEGKSNTSTQRTAIIPSSFGGNISVTSVNGKSSSGIFSLKQGEKITVDVTADNGYYVERVTVGGVSVEGINAEQKTCSFTLNYSDLQDSSVIIDTQFVAAAVQKFERENNQKVIQPTPEEIMVSGVSRTSASDPVPGAAPATQPSATNPAAAQASSQPGSDSGQPLATEFPSATAAPRFTPASAASIAESEPETSEDSLGTVAFTDIAIGGADSGLDSSVSSGKQDSNSDYMYWLILPILVLAAAAGAGIYRFTSKRQSRDNWK